jgi:cytochrome o ubiquinol oxidase subunit 3
MSRAAAAAAVLRRSESSSLMDSGFSSSAISSCSRALFAAYAILSGNTAGGPTGAELFNLRNVFIETICLLLSSYTCGIGALSAERGEPTRFLIFAVCTFALGAAFLFIEATEFARMVQMGAGPARSAFLSSFFTLVGTHGIHVAGACSGTRWISSGSAYSRWSI